MAVLGIDQGVVAVQLQGERRREGLALAFARGAPRGPCGAGFAFATGDSVETGLRQMLVYEPQSGKLLLNTKLEGLPKALGVSDMAPFFAIWGLAHMIPAQEA